MSKHRKYDPNFLCLVKGHEWVSNSWTGRSVYDEDYNHSYVEETRGLCCSREDCDGYKYEFHNWDHELTREERALERIRTRRNTQAMVWFLDNVQPAYSSDGSGYEQVDNKEPVG